MTETVYMVQSHSHKMFLQIQYSVQFFVLFLILHLLQVLLFISVILEAVVPAVLYPKQLLHQVDHGRVV